MMLLKKEANKAFRATYLSNMLEEPDNGKELRDAEADFIRCQGKPDT